MRARAATSARATEASPEGGSSAEVVGGELGHAGAGVLSRDGTPAPARLAWLRAFLRVRPPAHAVAALDGIRGIAASLVFVVHYHAAFGTLLAGEPLLGRLAGFATGVGYQGVNLFFVLSGFLIYGSLVGRPVPLRVYFWRRLRRIYPTFLVVLALYLTLGRAVETRDMLPADGALLYVVQNALLLPGVLPIEPIVSVSWSLSYEIFFYVGIAAVVTLLALRRWRARYRVGLFLAVLAAWVAGGAGLQTAVGSFVMFLPGILLWELSRSRLAERVRARANDWVVGGGLLSALLVAASVYRQPFHGIVERVGTTDAVVTVAALGVAVPLLILSAMGRGGRVARALAWEPLRVVGVASYSFYLIHGVAINVLALLVWRVLGPAPARGPLLYAVLIPVAYGASALVALVLFRTVEERLSL